MTTPNTAPDPDNADAAPTLPPGVDPYEFVGNVPPHALTAGHLALLNLAPPPEGIVAVTTAQGEVRHIMQTLPPEEIRRRMGHLGRLFGVDPDSGKRVAHPEVNPQVQVALGMAMGAHHRHVLPHDIAHQPPAPVHVSVPSESEVRTMQYFEDLREKRENVKDAHENVKEIKKDWAEAEEAPEAGEGLWTIDAYPEHLKTEDGKIIKPFARAKGSRWPRRLSMGSLLTRTEHRATNLPPAKQELKEEREGLKSTEAEGERLALADQTTRGIMALEWAEERKKHAEEVARLRAEGKNKEARQLEKDFVVTDRQRRVARDRNRKVIQGTLMPPDVK